MVGHYQEICKHCSVVLSQCRCPGQKTTTYGICVDCETNKEGTVYKFTLEVKTSKPCCSEEVKEQVKILLKSISGDILHADLACNVHLKLTDE